MKTGPVPIPSSSSHHSLEKDAAVCKTTSRNCRSLLHRILAKRHAKIRSLHAVAKGVKLTLLQEVHGSEREVPRPLHRSRSDYDLDCNFNDAHNAGGSTTLVGKSWAGALLNTIHPIVVHGRISRLEIDPPPGSFYIGHNIRNYGPDSDYADYAVDVIDKDI